MERPASNLAEARSAVEHLVGLPLSNKTSGMEAYISRKSLSKMLSESAVKKSSSLSAHTAAIANVDKLFSFAEILESRADRNGDKNLLAVHRFYTPLIHKGEVLAAKITVKESANPGNSNRIYTVEAVDIEKVKLAGLLASTPANSLGRSAPIASFIAKMQWLDEKVKSKIEKKLTTDSVATESLTVVREDKFWEDSIHLILRKSVHRYTLPYRKHSLNLVQTRDWYLGNKNAVIDGIISRLKLEGATLEEQAKVAFSIRNTFRTEVALSCRISGRRLRWIKLYLGRNL